MSEAFVPLPEPGPPSAPAPAPTDPGRRRQADLALVVAAFFFGVTFLVVQDAVDEASPVGFLAVRFLLGAARWPGATTPCASPVSSWPRSAWPAWGRRR